MKKGLYRKLNISLLSSFIYTHIVVTLYMCKQEKLIKKYVGFLLIERRLITNSHFKINACYTKRAVIEFWLQRNQCYT